MSEVTQLLSGDTNNRTRVRRASKAMLLPVITGFWSSSTLAGRREKRELGSQTPSEMDGAVFPLRVPSLCCDTLENDYKLDQTGTVKSEFA